MKRWKQMLTVIQIIQSLKKLQSKTRFKENIHFYKIIHSHQVSISTFNKLISNFVGGSLPRCDKGDREYYCTTMLTLFKPWRHGQDLKKKTSLGMNSQIISSPHTNLNS